MQTQSGLVMTLFTLFGLLPTMISTPLGGVWADRFDRKLLANLADMSIGIVSLVIAVFFFIGAPPLLLLLAASFVRSAGEGIQVPAVRSFIPDITPKEHLTRVNSVQSTLQSIAMIGSPALAGALMMFVPMSVLFLLNFVAALIGVATVFFVVKTPEKAKEQQAKRKDEAGGHFADFKSGLKYIKSTKCLRYLLPVLAVFAITVTPVGELAPLQVSRNYDNQVWQISSVEICFAVAMMIGGVILSVWGAKNREVLVVSGSFVALGVFNFIIGLPIPHWAYMIAFGFIGLCVSLFGTPLISLIQMNTDKKYHGRVMSVVIMVQTGAIPLTMLFLGPLSDVISINYIMLGAAFPMAACGIWLFAVRKKVLPNKE
jgi:DHA3 family macrolide efflux protein-like MFS transporter